MRRQIFAALRVPYDESDEVLLMQSQQEMQEFLPKISKRFGYELMASLMPQGTEVEDRQLRQEAILRLGALDFGQIRTITNPKIWATFVRFVAPISDSSTVVCYLLHNKINSNKRDALIAHCPHLTPLIYAFYNTHRKLDIYRQIGAVGIGSPSCARFLSGIVHDSTAFTLKLEPQYRTRTVMALLYGIKNTEDFSRFPIFADALEDAGWDHQESLKHFRTHKHFSLASWIFKAAGI